MSEIDKKIDESIMTKEKFITERTRIISEMLDNPDEYEIYPTGKCFEELDKLFDRLINQLKACRAQLPIADGINDWLNYKEVIQQTKKAVWKVISKIIDDCAGNVGLKAYCFEHLKGKLKHAIDNCKVGE